jgi:hypothetical protein
VPSLEQSLRLPCLLKQRHCRLRSRPGPLRADGEWIYAGAGRERGDVIRDNRIAFRLEESGSETVESPVMLVR